MLENYTFWENKPNKTGGVLIAAFEGWNDAGNASSWALKHLREDFDAKQFAYIEAEQFYDFSEIRPLVHLDENGRQLDWPVTRFSTDSGQNIFLLEGIEPVSYTHLTLPTIYSV